MIREGEGHCGSKYISFMPASCPFIGKSNF